MDCDRARELFSDYYDGVLDGETSDALRLHIESCPRCAEDYAAFRTLFDEIKTLPEPEVPADLHAKLIKATRIDAQPTAASTAIPAAKPSRHWKPFAHAAAGIAACFILVSVLITGAADIADAALPQAEATTGAPLTKETLLEPMAATAEAGITLMAADAAADAGLFKMLSAAPADTSELLAAGYYAQTFNIQLEVEDLSAAVETIQSLSGYAVSSNADFGANGGGSGRYIRRVDYAHYTQVKETLKQLGKIQSEQESAQKLANTIFDLEARLKAKEAECERLLALLEQSKTMDVMVAVESQYSNANAAREDFMGQLNHLYNQAEYPYIEITLTQAPPEPIVLPEKTYLEKLNETFIHSINGFIIFMEEAAVFFTGAALPLLIILVVVLMVWLFRKRAKNLKNTILLLVFALFAAYGCSSAAPEAASEPHYMTAPEEAPDMDYGNADAAPMATSPPESAAPEMNDYTADYAMPAGAPQEMPAPEASADILTDESVEKKILQTAYVHSKTDAFDQTVDSLHAAAINAGGFIENSSVYQNGYDYNNNPLRILDITLRVPRDMFDTVIEQVEGFAVLESSSRNAEDVTAGYYDLAARLDTKRVEEERVLDMITRAEKIEDLLALEARLGEIRTQIEVFESQLNNIDRLSAYSTIHVTLREAPAEELIVVSDDLGGRLQLALIRSVNNTAAFFQNALLFLAGVFIPLLFMVLLAVVGVVVYKRRKKK